MDFSKILVAKTMPILDRLDKYSMKRKRMCCLHEQRRYMGKHN